MDRRTCGVIFCCLGAVIYVIRHIIVAVLGSRLTSLSTEMYENLLKISGTELLYLSVIFILIGLIYIILSEISILKKWK